MPHAGKPSSRVIADDERDGGLGLKLLELMPRMTSDRYNALALENARRNKQRLGRGQSISALRGATLGEGDSAIVAAAGPSIRRQDPAKAVKARGFKGAIVCTESGLGYWLRNGVVPHLTVTVDPNLTRIVRWFGDPSLTPDKTKDDDYFQRQDQDSGFRDELRANEEMIELLNRHGRDIPIALSTSASPAVVDRVLEIGMPIYWWNPMLDDPDDPTSDTAALQRDNRLPCINAGGNVGAACWMMASAVLEKSPVALVGVDFAYYDGTPYRNTQYYHEAIDLVGEENLDTLYMRIYNPHTQSWFITDPAYRWYRENLLSMMAGSSCKTINCTEGGILFGPDVECRPLSWFLDNHS